MTIKRYLLLAALCVTHGIAHADDWHSLQCLLNYLHATTTLPTTVDDAAVTWTLTAADGQLLALNGNQLVVGTLPQGEAVKAGVLTATIDGGETRDFTVTLAPDDNKYGYLYCFMNPTTEVTNYALGTKNDKGKKFSVLLGGAEIFDTYALAGIEHGTRDAYLDRGQREGQYLITTTDMSNLRSGTWSNYGLNLLTSPDLIHWESTTFDFRKGKQIFSDPDATTDCYRTDEEYSRIRRVWAPEFIWDPTYDEGRGGYLVYYSLLSSNSWDTYDKIYYSYADRDFKTLTQPRLFFDPGYRVIDGDIIFNPYDNLYHMFYKHEESPNDEHGVWEATSPTLLGGEWTDCLQVKNEGYALCEGSSTVRRINEDVYNLYYMRYTDGYNYKVCETDHLNLNPTRSSNLAGNGNFQHGSLITITKDEYRMLEAWDKIQPLLTSSRSYTFEPSVAEAVAEAEAALELREVALLAKALPEACEVLETAMSEYKTKVLADLEAGVPTELTVLLANPTFLNGSDGWTTNAELTASQNGVAEFWNKTYNWYQPLSKMPAGGYRLTASAFYRNGSPEAAYNAHVGGKEKLNAAIYLNTKSSAIMSLYDESVSEVFTYEPFTYPNSLAEATEAMKAGCYVDNSVEAELTKTTTLRVGFRKNTSCSNDWLAISNLRLFYLGPETSIADVKAPASVDVVTLDGRVVRSGADAATATDGLPAGIYIIGNRKFVVK